MEDNKIVVTEEELKDVTQVQTLQQMNYANGNKDLPQQMDQATFNRQMALSHQMGLNAVLGAFKKLSKHGKDRIFSAIMSLPMEGLPVYLNGNFEKELYLGAQKLAMERAIIIFNSAKQTKAVEQEMLAKRKEQMQNESSKEETQTNSENTIVGSSGQTLS